MRAYAPRPIGFHGLREHTGYRLKRYSVRSGPAALDWGEFERGFALVLAELPAPAVTAERPGVGFSIAHRGRGADYAVLAWWDLENELPLRVAVRLDGDPAGWRAARRESICVWDLEILGFERDAYVATLLAGGSAEDYLARNLVAG